MAKKVPQLGQPFFIFTAYDQPTQQAHATVGAITAKMESRNGGIIFGRNFERERTTSKITLHLAHTILLSILDLQHEHFELKSLEQPLQRCEQDYKEIWDLLASGNVEHR